MSKAEPTVQKFMTTVPFSIEAGETLRKAEDLMARERIRHLPVMDRGRIAGVLSDRDIKMALGIEGVDPETVLVLDACRERPYTVDPDTPLGQVASTMAEEHYGSAIVVQNGKLVGIFTTVDACRALADVLATRFHTH